MMWKRILVFGCLMAMIAGNHASFAQQDTGERMLKTVWRKIGHELLLRSGDNTSRVLPIELKQGRLAVTFESGLQIDPQDLTHLVTTHMRELPGIQSCLVEVETCDSNLVAYSYRFVASDHPDAPACMGRVLPKACYGIFVTILKSQPVEVYTDLAPASSWKLFLAVLVLVVSAGIAWFFRRWKKKKRSSSGLPGVIAIGSFQFNPQQMKLTRADEVHELTGKETELLSQLYVFVNEVVDREALLQHVWGDEGDYIGRTLDVFISRLRKKLEADPSVRILNIRGVGYKLVIG